MSACVDCPDCDDGFIDVDYCTKRGEHMTAEVECETCGGSGLADPPEPVEVESNEERGAEASHEAPL